MLKRAGSDIMSAKSSGPRMPLAPRIAAGPA